MDTTDVAALASEHAIHTVEVAHPDWFGHLRGKRVPIKRFLADVDRSYGICEALFNLDINNGLADNPYLNSSTGYLDALLVADVSTARVLGHRPGYALVFTDANEHTGVSYDLGPRATLKRQVARVRAAGYEPVAATELEFFLLTPQWDPVANYIQYSSLTDAVHLEDAISAMRDALETAGMEVEGSNFEYGPGQVEINIAPADPVTCADNTVLFKSIVKQIARQHGLRASFMAKPWAGESGSGLHVHTSLNDGDGRNLFADSDHHPNALMEAWVAGVMHHASAMVLCGCPTPNGSKRTRPDTFSPTHITWGLDNRTVLARCTCEAGSSANRLEYRAAGADANPYIAIAAVLAAGLGGLENERTLGPMSHGDMYADPGDHVALPTRYEDAIEAFRNSALADMLGTRFSTLLVCHAEWELAQFTAAGCDSSDEVSPWERQRYLENT
jgi:glutamine synthetase